MTVDIVVPLIGEAVSELILSEWYRREGDTVAKGDPLFSIDSDKSVIDVEAFEDGTLAVIIHDDGSSVMPGQVVARMETRSAPFTPKADTPAIGIENATRSATIPQPATGPRGAASPKARAIARRRGTDLAGVTGSGVRGMVTASDLASDRSLIARDCQDE